MLIGSILLFVSGVHASEHLTLVEKLSLRSARYSIESTETGFKSNAEVSPAGGFFLSR